MDPPHTRRTTRGVTIGTTQFSNWLAWLARQ